MKIVRKMNKYPQQIRVYYDLENGVDDIFERHMDQIFFELGYWRTGQDLITDTRSLTYTKSPLRDKGE